MRDPGLVRYIKNRDGLSCHYCGKTLTLNRSRGRQGRNFATLDHKTPRGKGGSEYDPDNIVFACKDCNNRKGDMSYEDFKQTISPESEACGESR